MESAQSCPMGLTANTAMPQPELSEEELLLRVARKDARAFDHFYEAVAPRLLDLMRQMLQDEREAEEVLQDGFVHVWEHAASFDPAKTTAFIWSVMLFRHKAIERMRTLGRRNRLVSAETLSQAVFTDATPSTESGEKNPVHTAFNELPKDQQQLIAHAFLKGLTHHVIADSSGIPVESVRVGIRSGLLRFRQLLKGGTGT